VIEFTVIAGERLPEPKPTTTFTYLYGSSNNCAVIHKSVQFFEELNGYPKTRAVLGRTVRLFKNQSSFSNIRPVV
jgi:hypothetical protein